MRPGPLRANPDYIDTPNIPAGQTVDIEVPAVINLGTAVHFFATADYLQAIDEPNEDDNKRDITANFEWMPNLTFYDQRFAISPAPDRPAVYDLTVWVTNNGKGDSQTGFLDLGFTYTLGSFTDTVPTVRENSDYGQGESGTETVRRVLLDPGDYEFHALLDPDNVETESDESDNEATASVTVP